MLHSRTLTPEETAIYDGGDEPAQHAMLADWGEAYDGELDIELLHPDGFVVASYRWSRFPEYAHETE